MIRIPSLTKRLRLPVLVFVTVSMAMAQDESAPDLDSAVAQAVEKQLKACGVAAERVVEVTADLTTYLETGKRRMLRKHMTAKDPHIASIFLIFGLADDHPGVKRIIFKTLKRGEGNRPALLRSLSLVPIKKSVKLLIGKLDSNIQAEREAAMFALTSVTGETHDSEAAWKEWWAANKSALELPDQGDLGAKFSALQQAAFGKIEANLSQLFANEKAAPAGEALEALGGIVGGIMDAKKKGRQIKVSRLGKQGDAALRRGEIEKALTLYASASEMNGSDIRSRYLHGCLLLETRQWAEARKVLQAVAEDSPKCQTARCLSAFAKFFETNAEATVEEALEECFAEFANVDPDSLTDFATGDPIFDSLLQQQMAEIGILDPSFEFLSEKLEEAVGARDPELAVGIAWLFPRASRLGVLETLRQTFSKAPLVLAALVMENGDPEATRELVALDPKNLWYRLIIWGESPLPEDIEDRARERPFADEAISEIGEALDQSWHLNSYGIEMDKAYERALTELPIVFRAVASNRSRGSFSDLYRTFRRLGDSSQMLVQQAEERAVSFKKLGKKLCQTLWKEADTVVQLLMVVSYGATFEVVLFETEEGSTDIEAVWKARLKMIRERMFSIEPYGFMELLPVPMISNAIGEIADDRFELLKRDLEVHGKP